MIDESWPLKLTALVTESLRSKVSDDEMTMIAKSFDAMICWATIRQSESPALALDKIKLIYNEKAEEVMEFWKDSLDSAFSETKIPPNVF